MPRRKTIKAGNDVDDIINIAEPIVGDVINHVQGYIYTDPLTGKPFDMAKYRREQEFNNKVRSGEIKLKMDEDIYKDPKKYFRDLDKEMEEYKKMYGNGNGRKQYRQIHERRKKRGGAEEENVDLDAVIETQQKQLEDLNEQLKQQKYKNFTKIKPHLDERAKQIKEELIYLNHGYRPKRPDVAPEDVLAEPQYDEPQYEEYTYHDRFGQPKFGYRRRGTQRGGMVDDLINAALDAVPNIVNFVKNAVEDPEQEERIMKEKIEKIQSLNDDLEKTKKKVETATKFDYEKAKPILQKRTNTVLKNLRATYKKK